MGNRGPLGVRHSLAYTGGDSLPEGVVHLVGRPITRARRAV